MTKFSCVRVCVQIFFLLYCNNYSPYYKCMSEVRALYLNYYWCLALYGVCCIFEGVIWIQDSRPAGLSVLIIFSCHVWCNFLASFSIIHLSYCRCIICCPHLLWIWIYQGRFFTNCSIPLHSVMMECFVWLVPYRMMMDSSSGIFSIDVQFTTARPGVAYSIYYIYIYKNGGWYLRSLLNCAVHLCIHTQLHVLIACHIPGEHGLCIVSLFYKVHEQLVLLAFRMSKGPAWGRTQRLSRTVAERANSYELTLFARYLVVENIIPFFGVSLRLIIFHVHFYSVLNWEKTGRGCFNVNKMLPSFCTWS